MIKKFVSSAFFLLLSTAAFSQNDWSLYAGPQYTSARYRVNDSKQEVENKWGFHAGASLKIPFENQVFFAPHAYYSMKGFSVALKDRSFPPGEDAVGNDLTIHTLELAPLLHIDLSSSPSHLFLRFGPAIDLAISGKEKVLLSSGQTVNRQMTFNFANYGRITSSAVAHLGFVTQKGLYLQGQLSYGLGSLNNSDLGPKIRHTVFGLSIGKYIRRNPNVFDTRAIDR